MIAYKILTEYSGNSSEKLRSGNVVNMPYYDDKLFSLLVVESPLSCHLCYYNIYQIIFHDLEIPVLLA